MNTSPFTPDVTILAGAPRSGVRLLAAILDNHPRMSSGPDLPFVVTMAQQWHEIRQTLGANHAQFHALPPQQVRQAFQDAITRLFTPRLNQTGKPRFVLQSFAASVTLDVFAELFPASKFVFVVRDPRDIVLSLQRCEWRNPRDGTPLPYTRDPIAGARMWSEFMQIAMRTIPRLQASGRLALLRYEDLCVKPDVTLSRLAAFLNETQPAAQVTPASATLVTAASDNPHPPLRVGPINANSVGLWRLKLNGPALSAVRAIVFPLAGQFGYD